LQRKTSGLQGKISFLKENTFALTGRNFAIHGRDQRPCRNIVAE
jgi:hypothetical protein